MTGFKHRRSPWNLVIVLELPMSMNSIAEDIPLLAFILACNARLQGAGHT